MSRFAERTAVVTGGTRGIGKAIASALAGEGATVLLTGTDAERSQQVAEELAAKTGAAVLGTLCDVSKESSVQGLAAVAQDLLGHVDVLINNAAIARRNPIAQISLAEWNEVMSVNVTGTFLTTREMLPLMTGRAPAVVNVASQAGKRGEALLSHYASSKAAQICMTKSLALELAPHIRVNAVCPGFIETDMILQHYEVQAGLRQISPQDVRAEMLAKIPLGRMQQPESIASLVLFLASDDASDMTGQAVNITGGMVMD